MPEKSTTNLQGFKRDLVKEIQATRAIDFDRIGELVAKLPETVLDPGALAENGDDDGGDYVIKIVKSVLHVAEVDSQAQLRVDEVAKLRELNTRFAGLGR